MMYTEFVCVLDSSDENRQLIFNISIFVYHFSFVYSILSRRNSFVLVSFLFRYSESIEFVMNFLNAAQERLKEMQNFHKKIITLFVLFLSITIVIIIYYGRFIDYLKKGEVKKNYFRFSLFFLNIIYR